MSMEFAEYKFRKATGQHTNKKDYFEKLQKEVAVCPYCGAKTVLRPAVEIYRNSYNTEGKFLYVCSNYPEWNAYSRANKIETKNGKIVYIPVSTIANAPLRALRSEVHYYISLCVKFKIMRTDQDAYDWLRDRMNLTDAQRHIGRFYEANCHMAIEHLLMLLQLNRSKIGNKKLKAFRSTTVYVKQKRLDQLFNNQELVEN